MANYCGQCGAEIKPNAIACGKCNTPIQHAAVNSPVAPAAGNVQRWEYYTMVLTGGFMGRHKEELHRGKLNAELAALGQQGWELSWTLMEQGLQGEKDGHVLIFKRPVV